jgi:hypothetical protein
MTGVSDEYLFYCIEWSHQGWVKAGDLHAIVGHGARQGPLHSQSTEHGGTRNRTRTRTVLGLCAVHCNYFV